VGKFTDPDMTLEQMTERVRGKMRQMGVPSFLGYFFIRSIPKLKRWVG
jgi:predicted DNA-binding helix-hairpin-helix protein